MRKFVLGLDEGTTSLRSVLYDVDKKAIVDKEGKTFAQFFPHKAWVEQDAEEIFRKILSTSKAVLKRNHVLPEELCAIGITNQRETVVAWDKKTGKPICNAIVWQCRRTSNMMKRFSSADKQKIREKTGLLPNPYFSASKMRWILENVPKARTLAKKNELMFGTIDSFLAFRLTGNFVTDTTNACRTSLVNIKTLDYDDWLLEKFKIKREMLPKILPSDGNFGRAKSLLNAPICAMIGDQQSSMIGQGVLDVGKSKVTFGTGGFVLTNIGEKMKNVSGLLTTVARTIGGKTEYAIEGSMYSACSAINFLKTWGFYSDVGNTAKMAMSVKSNDGVYFIPAFTGLGAPYWRDDARGAIVGVTFDTTKAHVVRATLESMAYNTKAVADEIRKGGLNFKDISVDGGGSKNEFLLQFLADILGQKVVKSKESESTVMGAIYVAMLSKKLINKSEIKKLSHSEQIYLPNMKEAERKNLYEGWKKAIKKI